MAERQTSNPGRNRQLPNQQYRHKDGHQMIDDEEKNAKRMRALHTGGEDPEEKEEEFNDNIRDFGDYDDDERGYY